LVAENRDNQILDIIRLDLQFLLPLLIQFPKCYWIWNHRVWLLEQATTLLPAAKARPIWEEELRLTGKMLSRDSRNFHGWGYRRTIVDHLESNALDGKSMATDELDYTTRMINTNLSNFSAWHNRTKLISRILDEKGADDNERKQMLDQGRMNRLISVLYRLTGAEIALIRKALFDPYDQSLWFYHQNLLCTFDPDRASQTLAPQLGNSDRLSYVAKEIEFIEEMLDDFDDCKWIYQALIDCKLLAAKIQGFMSVQDEGEVKAWLSELKKLDHLREGRWIDLEQRLRI
jgi:geranylgeranyl transferase type-2 subunit alpha